MLCRTIMQLASHWASSRETEGVGFEPTVGCPTLDFESSALTASSMVQADWNYAKIGRAPHTPLVHGIFESFLATGCPKPICFPRKTALGGVKRFGHGKSSSPKKVLKYSVSVPRCLVDRKQHILKAL